MANIFCCPQNHDYNMAVSLITVIMSYASVVLDRSVVSFIAAIFRFCFVLLVCAF